MALWIAWLALAHADPLQVGEVVGVSTQVVDIYRFDLTACEGIRARAPAPRAPEGRAADKLVVILRNTTDTDCRYTGVALNGSLQGGYRVNPDPVDPPNLVVRAGRSVDLELSPTDGLVVRPMVELQIAPGRGYVLLTAPPPVTAPAPP